MGTNRGCRPSAVHIELNKQIVAARGAESILAIVEAEHGAFNAVNAATACNRLAKTRQAWSQCPRMDDHRVQTLFSTLVRVSADMVGQKRGRHGLGSSDARVAGWGGADAVCAGGGCGAVRVAPSMNAQNVANVMGGGGNARMVDGTQLTVKRLGFSQCMK